MNNCKECKHWWFNSKWDKEWGECRRIEDRLKSPAYIALYSSEDCDGTLKTKPDFGCVLFENDSSG